MCWCCYLVVVLRGLQTSNRTCAPGSQGKSFHQMTRNYNGACAHHGESYDGICALWHFEHAFQLCSLFQTCQLLSHSAAVSPQVRGCGKESVLVIHAHRMSYKWFPTTRSRKQLWPTHNGPQWVDASASTFVMSYLCWPSCSDSLRTSRNFQTFAG